MDPLPLTSSANGRVSSKSWKLDKLRTNITASGMSKTFQSRMEQTTKNMAVKKLEKELKDEKQAELMRRREVTKERKKAAEEKRRLEEDKAKMGARKAARLRRKAGRTKKING